MTMTDSAMKRLFDTIPTDIYLGYRKYRVEVLSVDEMTVKVKNFDTAGGVRHSDANIYVSEDHVLPVELVNTLLHECIHSAVNLYGHSSSYDEEEKFVRAATNGIVELFRRNPDMLKWVAEGLKD